MKDRSLPMPQALIALILIAGMSVSCGLRRRPAPPPPQVAPPTQVQPNATDAAPPASGEVSSTEEISAPVEPPAPPPPPPPPKAVKTLNVCTLLPNMKPCWKKATDLLARIQSCGALGASYGEGIKEEMDRLHVETSNRGVEVASFACAGLCSMHRAETDLTWEDACLTAAATMKCDPSACN